MYSAEKEFLIDVLIAFEIVEDEIVFGQIERFSVIDSEEWKISYIAPAYMELQELEAIHKNYKKVMEFVETYTGDKKLKVSW